MHGLTVRRLDVDDVSFAARLHHQCLPDGFFAKLGEPFLGTYYRCFARSPWAICLVAEVDGDRAGILVATVDSWQHYRFAVRRCGGRLALSGFSALATRPRLAVWFLRTRGHRYARGLVRLIHRRAPRSGTAGASRSAPQPGSGEAVLVHVAVDGRWRRHGVGGALVGAFLDEARRQGPTRARLMADTGDDGALRFYRGLGWAQVGEVTDADARRWARFVRDV